MGKSLVTGIDIGHHSIKVVVLKLYKDTYELVDHQELPVESDILSDNHKTNYQKIVKKLTELRKRLPLFSHKVALAIPDNLIISKELQLDSTLNSEEVEYAIRQIFSQQTTLDGDKLAIDYIYIGEDSYNSSHLFRVFAAKKEDLLAPIDMVKKSGYQPILMDVEGYCRALICHLVAQKFAREDWLLVDIGLNRISVCAFASKKMPICVDFSIERFADNGDIEKRNAYLAERVKVNLTTMDSLRDTAISFVWLAGGGALSQGLEVALSLALGLPCERFYPFGVFEKQPSSILDKEHSQCVYATAIGIALRGLAWMSDHD